MDARDDRGKNGSQNPHPNVAKDATLGWGTRHLAGDDLFDIVARIDDHCFARGLVADDGAVAPQQPNRKNLVDRSFIVAQAASVRGHKPETSYVAIDPTDSASESQVVGHETNSGQRSQPPDYGRCQNQPLHLYHLAHQVLKRRIPMQRQ
jgi:hypothetical protein